MLLILEKHVHELLKVSNLTLSIHGKRLVNSVSFSIVPEQTLALIGESGSGKTITSLAIARMLPELLIDSGEIIFSGNDIANLDSESLRKIRGKDISYVFQEPLSALNPLHKVHRQIGELLKVHSYKGNFSKRIDELLAMVELDPESSKERYPHQLSGGQRQRVMIAMALANSPKLLIADEPTTALDRKVQWQILDLLKVLQKDSGLTILLISHDLRMVRHYADHVVIMRQGRIVESGDSDTIFETPREQYTRMLLEPLLKGKPTPITGMQQAVPLLKVESLHINYPIRKGIFKRIVDYNLVVNDLDFDLHAGETIGLVGASGSGKSSIGLAILRLINSQGSIRFLDQQIELYNRKQMRALRRDMQIVFQDPFASLNPKMTLFQILCEGVAIHITKNPKEQRYMVAEALEMVGLETSMIDRYAHEFSGGQRQRVALARALIINPKLLILDEPTSMLDRAYQRQILDLLKQLQQQFQLAYIFISHDQEAVDTISHKIIKLENNP